MGSHLERLWSKQAVQSSTIRHTHTHTRACVRRSEQRVNSSSHPLPGEETHRKRKRTRVRDEGQHTFDKSFIYSPWRPLWEGGGSDGLSKYLRDMNENFFPQVKFLYFLFRTCRRVFFYPLHNVQLRNIRACLRVFLIKNQTCVRDGMLK